MVKSISKVADLGRGVVVDGYSLSYRVAKEEDGTYRVTILSQSVGTTDDPREWTPADAATFLDETAANRYGRYVMLSITKVRANGDCIATVV